MADFVVRRAVPTDAAVVRALTRHAYQKWVPVIGREPRPMTADYDQAVMAHEIDLFEDDCGLAALIEMKAEADHLLIVNVAVHPDRHGQGIGSQLLRHAEDVARVRGLEELCLYTNGAFTSNIELYQRRGYRETHREEAGPLGIVVYMTKQIDPA